MWIPIGRGCSAMSHVTKVVVENVERMPQEGSRLFWSQGIRVITTFPLAKYHCMFDALGVGGEKDFCREVDACPPVRFGLAALYEVQHGLVCLVAEPAIVVGLARMPVPDVQGAMYKLPPLLLLRVV